MYLMTMVICSCCRNSYQKVSSYERIGDTYFGEFKVSIIGIIFSKFTIIKLKGLDGINFYAIEADDSIYSQLEQGKIYSLMLSPIKDLPDLEIRSPNIVEYYLGDELFWEEGKIYPKCYSIVKMF